MDKLKVIAEGAELLLPACVLHVKQWSVKLTWWVHHQLRTSLKMERESLEQSGYL